MNRIFRAALVAAGLAAGSTASAAVVVYTPTPLAPSGATLTVGADISVGQFISAAEVLVPGDSAEFTFTALERLRVSTIALSGSGNNGGTDLANVEFGLSSATTEMFASIINFGPSASAFASLAGFDMAAGDSFTIFWEDGITAPVALTASFSTTAVPVPAAMPLLIGGLAALGAIGRKKKTS